jgi:hypothetical protein
MRSHALRLWLIGVLFAAAAISVVGNKTGSRLVNWLSFVAFLIGVCLYGAWRRAVYVERGGRVFDREAKTDETRTRPDQ